MQANYAALGLDSSANDSQVRNAWKRLSRKHHPDKGGDSATFQSIRAAYDAIRLKSRRATTDAEANDGSDDAVPYKVEAAKTGAGKCVTTQESIEKGALKVGSFVKQVDDYGRWSSLSSWTIPYRIHAHVAKGSPDNKDDVDRVLSILPLMENVCLTGISALTPDQKIELAKHLLSGTRAEHKNKPPPPPLDPVLSGSATSATSVATTKRKGGPDLPSVDGAPLAGSTFVLTGVFPAQGGGGGGGGGLNAGKAHVKSWIESAGGKVVGSISKKTSFLVVGDEPGASKVTQAESMNVPTATLESLQQAVKEGDVSKAKVDDVHIESFSRGFGNASQRRRLM